MKPGTIGSLSAPDEKELELINKHTRRQMTAEELYTFGVVLCDNEVDRDYERFSEKSLKALAEMFIGKTGIFDHSQKGRDQCARIYTAEAVKAEGVKTKSGDDYVMLKARAYMPRLESNEQLISEIDAGIKKEVSVGCSCADRICSICGSPAGYCEHKKGRYYKTAGGKQLCFFSLENPTDAYEWSFVAVPAQRNAGVTKSYGGAREESMKTEDIIKSLETAEGGITLSQDETESLKSYIADLKASASAADEFLSEKKRAILRHCADSTDPETASLVSAALDRMSGTELFKMFNRLENRERDIHAQITAKPMMRTGKATNENNRAFSL